MRACKTPLQPYGQDLRFFRFAYYVSAYVDYQKVYPYLKTVDGVESGTAVTEGGNVSNVVHWVQYREK